MGLKEKERFVSEIKSKKELQGLADSLVLKNLDEWLARNKIDFFQTTSRERKIILKEVRARLRLLAGRFQKRVKDKKSLLNSEDVSLLLSSHLSTSERIDFYPSLKKIISDLHVRSILELGCGLNPIALSSKDIYYYASDINLDDLKIVSSYFHKKNFPGETFYFDISNPHVRLPKTDICLIFKVLDIADTTHKTVEPLLKIIPSEKILVSFSKIKLSGRRMNFPKRFWFEKLLQRLGYTYSSFESSNEFFYLISKYN